jgi:hypothetical protein
MTDMFFLKKFLKKGLFRCRISLQRDCKWSQVDLKSSYRSIAEILIFLTKKCKNHAFQNIELCDQFMRIMHMLYIFGKIRNDSFI